MTTTQFMIEEMEHVEGHHRSIISALQVRVLSVRHWLTVTNAPASCTHTSRQRSRGEHALLIIVRLGRVVRTQFGRNESPIT